MEKLTLVTMYQLGKRFAVSVAIMAKEFLIRRPGTHLPRCHVGPGVSGWARRHVRVHFLVGRRFGIPCIPVGRGNTHA
jgi:hypothetical protein